MITEPIQNPLFDDPLGITLKHARQRKDMSIESVAKQLRLPAAVIEAMEMEAWQKLGAPIYVKSYLGSYLKLLGLPEHLLNSARAQRTDPGIVARAPVSNVQRTLHRSWRRIIYMVMTGVLVGSVAMLAMHLQSRGGPTEAISLGDPVSVEVAAAPDQEALVLPQPQAVATSPDMPVTDLTTAATVPVAASLTPMPAAVGEAGLVLHFRGESWVDIVDGKGRQVERGMVVVGSDRHFPPGTVSRVTLGNASMVDVLRDGKSVDLAPFLTENVARFEVSSSGEIAAPGG